MTKPKKNESNERNSLVALYSKRDRALERLIAAWKEGEASGVRDLNCEIDALTLAQVAVTFEMHSERRK
jgi:hypothetical protein